MYSTQINKTLKILLGKDPPQFVALYQVMTQRISSSQKVHIHCISSTRKTLNPKSLHASVTLSNEQETHPPSH